MLHTFRCRNIYQTLYSRVCPKKLIDAQLVKFLAFYKPWIYISQYLVCLIVLTSVSRFTSTFGTYPKKQMMLSSSSLPVVHGFVYDWCKTCQFWPFRVLGIHRVWRWCTKKHVHFIAVGDPAWSGHYELLRVQTPTSSIK